MQINNLGSNLRLASIAKIARCLQVFLLASSFLSIRFAMKVYPLYNAMFRLQYSEFTYHPSPGMVIAARCPKIARTPSKPRCAGHAVYKKSYQMSGLASMCIMFKCHILLYVELNKIHVYMYSYGIVNGSTIFRYDLIDRLPCTGIQK